MNLTDLCEVLDERSSTDHVEVGPHEMLTGVRRRLAIRRRYRQVTAVTAAIVAALSVGAVTHIMTRSTELTGDPAATPSVAMINGFPQYADGARLIVTSPPVASTATSLRLSFTPTTTGVVFFVRCSDSDKKYEMSLDGRPIISGGCSGSYTPDPVTMRQRIGKLNIVTVTFPDGPPANFGVAVGEKIDPAQYVYPARPAKLQPLDLGPGNMQSGFSGNAEYQTTKVVRADPADPNRPMKLTFAWGKGVHLMLRSQTPGALTVSINGAAIAHGEWWDYNQKMVDQGSDQDWSSTQEEDRNGWVRPRQGSSTTITVKPERMTGDWAVAIQEPS